MELKTFFRKNLNLISCALSISGYLVQRLCSNSVTRFGGILSLRPNVYNHWEYFSIWQNFEPNSANCFC